MRARDKEAKVSRLQLRPWFLGFRYGHEVEGVTVRGMISQTSRKRVSYDLERFAGVLDPEYLRKIMRALAEGLISVKGLGRQS